MDLTKRKIFFLNKQFGIQFGCFDGVRLKQAKEGKNEQHLTAWIGTMKEYFSTGEILTIYIFGPIRLVKISGELK